jgi:hypothetical protein
MSQFFEPKGANPHENAALIHRLRLESSHTATATVLPQPLHDMQTVTQYLSRLVDNEADDDLNATGEPTQE